MKFLRRHVWTIGIVYGLLMITTMRFCLTRDGDPPPVYSELPAAQLMTQDKEPFSLPASLDQKIWVFGFVFTRCVTSCPRVVEDMKSFQKEIRDAKLAKFVEFAAVSVDPEHDTPARLAKYAQEREIDLSNWTFLTGQKEPVQSFVVDGFKLAVGEKTEIPGGAFDIAHSLKMALVDRSGRVRGYYSLTDKGEFGRDHLLSAILRLTRERP